MRKDVELDFVSWTTEAECLLRVEEVGVFHFSFPSLPFLSLLSVYSEPGAVLGTREATRNKRDLVHLGAHGLMGF